MPRSKKLKSVKKPKTKTNIKNSSNIKNKNSSNINININTAGKGKRSGGGQKPITKTIYQSVPTFYTIPQQAPQPLNIYLNNNDQQMPNNNAGRTPTTNSLTNIKNNDELSNNDKNDNLYYSSGDNNKNFKTFSNDTDNKSTSNYSNTTFSTNERPITTARNRLIPEFRNTPATNFFNGSNESTRSSKSSSKSSSSKESLKGVNDNVEDKISASIGSTPTTSTLFFTKESDDDNMSVLSKLTNNSSSFSSKNLLKNKINVLPIDTLEEKSVKSRASGSFVSLQGLYPLENSVFSGSPPPQNPLLKENEKEESPIQILKRKKAPNRPKEVIEAEKAATLQRRQQADEKKILEQGNELITQIIKDNDEESYANALAKSTLEKDDNIKEVPEIIEIVFQQPTKDDAENLINYYVKQDEIKKNEALKKFNENQKSEESPARLLFGEIVDKTRERKAVLSKNIKAFKQKNTAAAKINKEKPKEKTTMEILQDERVQQERYKEQERLEKKARDDLKKKNEEEEQKNQEQIMLKPSSESISSKKSTSSKKSVSSKKSRSSKSQSMETTSQELAKISSLKKVTSRKK